jgi:hypothetical protein
MTIQMDRQVNVGMIIPPWMPRPTRHESQRFDIQLPDDPRCRLSITICHYYSPHAKPRPDQPHEVLRYTEGHATLYLADGSSNQFRSLSKLHHLDNDDWSPEIGMANALAALCDDMEFHVSVPKYASLRTELTRLWSDWYRCSDRALRDKLMQRIQRQTGICEGCRLAFRMAYPAVAEAWKDRRARIYQFCLPTKAELIAQTGRGYSLEELDEQKEQGQCGIAPAVPLTETKKAPTIPMLDPADATLAREVIGIFGKYDDLNQGLSARDLADLVEQDYSHAIDDAALRSLLNRYPGVFVVMNATLPVRYRLLHDDSTRGERLAGRRRRPGST